MPTLYLSIGTNLGDRQFNLDTALTLIGQDIGTVKAVSKVIETEPWGYESDNRFLNMVMKVETMLTPQQALSATRSIERTMGRKEKSSNVRYLILNNKFKFLSYYCFGVGALTLILSFIL